MKFRAVCLSAALAVAFSAASPAVQAQDRNTVGASADTAEESRKLALTRRYIDVMMADQFDAIIRELVADTIAMDPASQDIPDADREFLINLTAELTADMMPRMLDEMAPVYARAFTVEELEALVEFYESDVGRSIAAKSIIVMPEANRAAMTVMPAMLDKMAARICQHYGCEAGELEALQREMRGETVAAPPSRK